MDVVLVVFRLQQFDRVHSRSVPHGVHLADRDAGCTALYLRLPQQQQQQLLLLLLPLLYCKLQTYLMS